MKGKGRPASTQDAILRLLPFAGDPAAAWTTWTIRDLAAAIYAGGDPAKVRPTHIAAVTRALYRLRRADVVNHTPHRSRRLGFFWYRIHPDAIGRLMHQLDADDDRQELRQRLVKILGMTESAHAGERENATKLANDLLRQAGITWEELFGR